MLGVASGRRPLRMPILLGVNRSAARLYLAGSPAAAASTWLLPDVLTAPAPAGCCNGATYKTESESSLSQGAQSGIMCQVLVLACLKSIGKTPDNRMGGLPGKLNEGVVSDTEHLIAEQIPKLRRYARALLGDPVRADDLVQEALVRALSRSHLWQPGTDIRAWMFTILHNVHVNNQRQRRHRDDYQELSDDRPEMATPATQERTLEMRDLARGLQLLPSPQRQVVLLVGLEGMNYKQVAAVLDIPIGTVMSRLHRGREALRRLMTDGPAQSASNQDSKVRTVP